LARRDATLLSAMNVTDDLDATQPDTGIIARPSWVHELAVPVLNHVPNTQDVRGCMKSFRTESITKCKLTTINTREATQRVMAAKLTRLAQKIAI
jgi:hypothetical protein